MLNINKTKNQNIVSIVYGGMACQTRQVMWLNTWSDWRDESDPKDRLAQAQIAVRYECGAREVTYMYTCTSIIHDKLRYVKMIYIHILTLILDYMNAAFSESTIVN